MWILATVPQSSKNFDRHHTLPQMIGQHFVSNHTLQWQTIYGHVRLATDSIAQCSLGQHSSIDLLLDQKPLRYLSMFCDRFFHRTHKFYHSRRQHHVEIEWTATEVSKSICWISDCTFHSFVIGLHRSLCLR